MADWNIRPRAMNCVDCGQPFTPRMTGHTVLTQTEAGYLRNDLCDACFKKRAASSEGFTSAAWSFTVPVERGKNTKKEAPVKKETAIQLLRKLVARENPEDCGAIYILAILLERNKQFIERDVRQNADGIITRLYEFKPTGELFSVEAPNLRPDNLEAVQRRVIDLLEGRETITPATPALPPARPLRKWRIAFHPTTLPKRYKRRF